MIRKFECNNCKCRFEADDERQVLCPECKSENVEYAHFHIPSIVWKIIGVVLALTILGIIVSLIDWKQSEEPGEIATNNKDSLAIVRDTTFIKETGLSLPPVINVGDLTYEKQGYRFEVTVDNPPMAKYYFAIVDPYDKNKIVAKSENGSFKDIPYSTADGGVFEVSLFDSSSDTLICSIEKTGFIKQQAVEKKMSVSELQNKINNRDSSLMGVGENDYLNPNYELKLVGLSSDAVNVPTTLGEVFDKLENDIWESVKVNSLEYDEMNRIKKIALSIKEF